MKLYQVFGKLYGKPFTAGFVTKVWSDGRETVTGSAPILRKRLRRESIEYVQKHCRENSWTLREVT